MRVLFVTPMIPGVAGGPRVRTFNLIKQLAAQHEVSLLSLVQPFEYGMLPALKSLCRRVELVPFAGFVPSNKWHNRLQGWWRLLFDPRPPYSWTFPVKTMRKPLKALVTQLGVDLVQFEQLFTAELLPVVGPLPSVLGEHNVESEIARGAQRVPGNPIHRLRERLTLNYPPNIDGVLFFCRNIWPWLHQALPDLRLTIVGAQPAPEVLALQTLPNVTVTGFVEDIRPYFWRATASVVPLRSGGGTRLCRLRLARKGWIWSRGRICWWPMTQKPLSPAHCSCLPSAGSATSWRFMASRPSQAAMIGRLSCSA